MNRKTLKFAVGLDHKTVHDSDDTTPVHVAEERGFRRGFMQGACFAVRAASKGASMPALHLWAEHTLWYWRNRAPIERAVLPPEPPLPELPSAGAISKRSAA